MVCHAGRRDGSGKFPEGSRIAVKTAGDYLLNQLSGVKGVHLKQHITAWKGAISRQQ